MSIDHAIYTNIGDCAVNEDYAAAYEGTVSAYILADGLGGHGGGDIASRFVVEDIINTVSGAEKISVELLEKCFIEAQQKLLEKQRELKREGALKTTLVVLLTDGNIAMWGHIGDSRLYYCKRNKVKSRTTDHSVPQMLLSMGKIKEKNIKHHAERNVLLKVMGIKWNDNKMFEVDCRGMKLHKGDAFILCTDGFWEWVDDSVMAKRLCSDSSASDIANELGDEAYSNGMGTDRDNITNLVLIVK